MPDTDLAAVNAAAERIRTQVPIRGKSATDKECGARAEAHHAQLEEWGVAPDDYQQFRERHRWFYVTLTDGQRVGSWACSPESAALSCATWWGVPAAEVHDIAMEKDGQGALW